MLGSDREELGLGIADRWSEAISFGTC